MALAVTVHTLNSSEEREAGVLTASGAPSAVYSSEETALTVHIVNNFEETGASVLTVHAVNSSEVKEASAMTVHAVNSCRETEALTVNGLAVNGCEETDG